MQVDWILLVPIGNCPHVFKDSFFHYMCHAAHVPKFVRTLQHIYDERAVACKELVYANHGVGTSVPVFLDHPAIPTGLTVAAWEETLKVNSPAALPFCKVTVYK